MRPDSFAQLREEVMNMKKEYTMKITVLPGFAWEFSVSIARS
jgi:hypothetical protein